MALTEPTPVPRIADYPQTNNGALSYGADSNAAARKANADKARIRELAYPTLWQRIRGWFRR